MPQPDNIKSPYELSEEVKQCKHDLARSVGATAFLLGQITEAASGKPSARTYANLTAIIVKNPGLIDGVDESRLASITGKSEEQIKTEAATLVDLGILLSNSDGTWHHDSGYTLSIADELAGKAATLQDRE